MQLAIEVEQEEEWVKEALRSIAQVLAELRRERLPIHHPQDQEKK